MVIFCEASVSIPLMHNVARNCQTTYPQPLRMPRTCADGPNLREVGIRKTQPNHTPPGTLLGERMQCSVWAPGTLPCLCQASALYIARFGARRFLCRDPALRRGLALCVGLRRSAGALCVGARSQIRVSPSAHTPSSDLRPRGLPAPIRTPPIRFAGPQLRSACHPSGPWAPSPDPRATHPARRVPFFQERTSNLTVWEKNSLYILLYF